MLSYDDALARLRTICLALPEAAEDGGVGNPSFKVRSKIFAMQHGMNGRPSVWFKAPRGLQEAMVDDDPDTFFAPPYVAVHGWIGAYLDIDLDWDEIDGLVRDSYRMTAPKRLARTMDEG